MNKARRIGDTLWVHKDGRTYSVYLNESSEVGYSKKSTNVIGGTGQLNSPMPGKILKVDAKVGQSLRPGQTVCVIEAMKMEYALKAPFNSKVKEIFKKAGDQVLLNEKVALLEEVK